MEALREEGPGELDSLFLEVIAKGPVAQHLKHGVVVGIASYLLEVVVLTADAEALLRVCCTTILRLFIAQDDILKLVHPGIGKHKCGVVLDHHRCRGNYAVSVFLKEVEEGLSYIVCCHHNL